MSYVKNDISFRSESECWRNKGQAPQQSIGQTQKLELIRTFECINVQTLGTDSNASKFHETKVSVADYIRRMPVAVQVLTISAYIKIELSNNDILLPFLYVYYSGGHEEWDGWGM